MPYPLVLLAMLAQAPAEPVLPAGMPVARLTRLADPVAWLDGEARAERVLFFWNKAAPLRVGDGVRTGAAGIAELYYPDDQTEIRLFGEALIRLGPVTANERLLDVVALRRAFANLRGPETVWKLPGGTEVRAADTVVRLELDEFDRRWRIRNAGPGEVRVKGPVTPIEFAAVPAGHEVAIPLVESAPRAVTADSQETLEHWEGQVVRLGPGVRSSKRDERLVLEGAGLARVGGARIVVRDGRAVTLRKPRR